MAELAFEKNLQKWLKQKPLQKGEKRQKYIDRIVGAMLSLPEAKQDVLFGKLNTAGQAWINAVIQAHNDSGTYPDFAAVKPAKGKKAAAAEPEAEEETAETDTDEAADSEEDDPFAEDSGEETAEAEEDSGEETADEEEIETADSEDDPFAEDEIGGETEEETADTETESEEDDGAAEFEDNDEPPVAPARKAVTKGKAAPATKGKAAAPKADTADEKKKKAAATKALREMLINSAGKIMAAYDKDAPGTLAKCQAALAKKGFELDAATAAMHFYTIVTVLKALDEKGYLQFPEA